MIDVVIRGAKFGAEVPVRRGWWRFLHPGLAAMVLAGVAWTDVDAAQPVPQTRVTYSDAYGKNGTQPEVKASDMPRFPAVEPAKAAGTFQVRKGFRMDLVASEPLVASPVTISFDENGRMFVLEMIDYSERREETPHAGRVRMLEDVDGDGHYDKSTVYADNLPWPTALICYGGGVFVGATPDIVWLKDTTGDGRADERKVVYTGFASGADRLNVQALLNSFNWSLDNRIRGATGPIGGNRVYGTSNESKPLDLRGRDFSFDPRSSAIRPEAGGAQYGLSFDSQGRTFLCSNSDHLQLLMFDLKYSGLNPAFSMPNPRISIAVDGPAAEVFRISPDEPWRIVRTRWRISGVVPGMVEGGGRVSGYFTGATGATIYRGDAYGPDFADNAFIGDAGGNLVHRKLVHPDGVSLLAKRAADELTSEFVASRDTWFRPVHFQNGPDGCLYIVDMYREVIEHPWSLPEAIKKHVDLNSGNDRGRIWRVLPENFKQPAPPRLGTATMAVLVASLESGNGWTRETAARLIYERQDSSAVPVLESLLAKKSGAALGRMHALYALQGLGRLKSSHVAGALEDSDERVREHAIRLAETLLESRSEGAAGLDGKLIGLVTDPSMRVRYQLALSLAFSGHPSRLDALASIIRQDVQSSWVQAAVLNSLIDGAGRMFVQLQQAAGFCQSKEGREFLGRLAELIGARGVEAEVGAVLETSTRPGSPLRTAAIVRALGAGTGRAGKSLASLDKQGRLKAVYARAAETATDETAAVASREEAVELLSLTGFEESGAKLTALLDSGEERVRLAAIQAISRYPNPGIGEALLSRWNSFPPGARSAALAALTMRADRALLLLQALDSNQVKAADIPAATARVLQSSKDKPVASLAAKVFPQDPKPADVLKSFQTALDLRGDAARGRALFVERCASCHRAGKEGFALGPDFVTVRTAGREKLLSSIVDPNAEIAPQYIAFQVDTRDDESYTAVIAGETPAELTLKMASGQQLVLPRNKVKGMKSSGQSLMPEGLANGLNPQAMSDLLEFVLTAEAPAADR